MSDTALRTDGSLEAQPKMGVRNLHNFISCPPAQKELIYGR